MEFSIVSIPSYRIAYIRKIGPYGINNVQTMEELKKWANLNNLFNDESIILGIAQDNPETTAPESCRYDTCIVISDSYTVTDSPVKESNIAGGKYAVFKINHTAEAVQKAWVDIFPELSSQNYRLDDSRPILERYKVKMVNNHLCEICLPVL